jgi:hypothetical protein
MFHVKHFGMIAGRNKDTLARRGDSLLGGIFWKLKRSYGMNDTAASHSGPGAGRAAGDNDLALPLRAIFAPRLVFRSGLGTLNCDRGRGMPVSGSGSVTWDQRMAT